MSEIPRYRARSIKTQSQPHMSISVRGSGTCREAPREISRRQRGGEDCGNQPRVFGPSALAAVFARCGRASHPREFSFFVTERTDGVFASCATQADPHPPIQQRAVAWRIKTQMGGRPPVRPNNLAAPILSPCHHCHPSPQPQRASAGAPAPPTVSLLIRA